MFISYLGYLLVKYMKLMMRRKTFQFVLDVFLREESFPLDDEL